MKIAGRLAAAVGALALGSGLAVVTGPADAAAAPVATTTTLTVTDYSASDGKVRFGDYVSVTAKVTGTDGKSPVYGGLVIETAPIGSSTWTVVDSNDYPSGYYSIEGIRSGVQIRATYAGSASDPDFNPTYSTPYTASAGAYTIASLDRGTAVAKQTKKKVCYQVGPAPYKNKPIKYYVKVGKSKKWRAAGSVRTNKKSQYCYKITHTKVKTPVKYKGPKVKAFKTVYVKTGGMKKSVQISTY